MEQGSYSLGDVAGALHAYVPPYVRWRLERSPLPVAGPFEDLYTAAVVHADVSGFTALAEQHASRGAAGAEHVRDVLDGFFGDFGEVVAAHGGHSLAFAGDAATAMWRLLPGGRVRDMVGAAVRCGAALRSRLTGRAALEGRPQLRLRLAVGCGELRAAVLGGVENRWLPIVHGKAIEQIWRAQRHRRAGELVLSPEAWAHCPADVAGDRLPDGSVVLTGIADVAARNVGMPDDPHPCVADLRPYVPRSVQARLEAGAVGWLAEYRHGAVAFVRFGDAGAAATSLQVLVEIVQDEVCASGGSINKVLAEDGVLTAVAAWGLPLESHEDDCARSIRAALKIETRLMARGVSAATGVASGRFFMGHAGTRHHREFALLGDVVNIAARLAVEAPPAIRCDAATRSAARTQIAFKAMLPAQLRNRSAAVAVYCPLAEKPHGGNRDELIGRRPERQRLRAALDRLEAGDGPVVVSIEGEAGIGKSRLAADLVAQTQHRPIQSLIGRGESLERAAPYHGWRDVFSRLLRIDTVADRDAQRARVLDLLDTPERRSRVALTNVVLPLDFSETRETASLLPPARARATRELLVYLLRRAIGVQPTVIVLEDAHWLDSASWALAHDVAAAAARILLVLVARPVAAEQMSADWRALRDSPSTLRVRLEALARDEALSLACLRLDVDSLPAEVADQILATAEGHPFFTEQLLLAMRDKDRVLRIDAGECHVVQSLSTVTFAETVHTLVDSRIDGLTLQQQDTLKVAAVLGRRFDLGSLRRTHSGNPDTADLQKQLDALAELELLRVFEGPSGRTYAFKHAITQEAVSRWLLPSERRNLNARVAQMIEERHPADLTPVHALLAHHWREAGITTKALDYLELAAQRALREDANHEALEYLGQALAYGQEAASLDTALPLRQAVWKRQFAEACWVLGDTPRAREYVAQAMAALHRPAIRPGAELAAQLLIRVGHALTPQRLLVVKDPRRREHLLELSRAAALSATLHTDPVDYVGALGGGFLAQNLAERAGSASVSALAMLAYAAGMLKLRRLARAYFSRMRQEAHAQNDIRSLLFGVLLESMHLFSDGRLAEAEGRLREGLAWADVGGNQRDRARLLMLLAATVCFSGRMQVGVAAMEEAYKLAMYGDRAAVERSWSLIIMGGVYAQHLTAEEALAIYETLRPKIAASLEGDLMADGMTPNPLRVATAAALAALVNARAGRLADALAGAAEALKFLDSPRNLPIIHPSTWILLQGPLETYWLALERGPHGDPEQVRAVGACARRFARSLCRFARMHPAYRSRAMLFRGVVAHAGMAPLRARAWWDRSLAAATALGARQEGASDCCFVFDRGLALFALGTSQPSPADRRRLLAASRQCFADCGIPSFCQRVDALLDASAGALAETSS